MTNLLTQRGWEETTATITGCDARQLIPRRGRLPFGRTGVSYYYEVSFVYAAKGATYTSNFIAYEPHTEGRTLDILYDPANPQRNSKNDPRGDNMTIIVITVVCIAVALLLVLFLSAHNS
jgi:hypothetical protein